MHATSQTQNNEVKLCVLAVYVKC